MDAWSVWIIAPSLYVQAVVKLSVSLARRRLRVHRGGLSVVRGLSCHVVVVAVAVVVGGAPPSSSSSRTERKNYRRSSNSGGSRRARRHFESRSSASCRFFSHIFMVDAPARRSALSALETKLSVGPSLRGFFSVPSPRPPVPASS